MGLADALTRLTVELSVHTSGELAQVCAGVDHPDWMEIDEDEDSELYRRFGEILCEKPSLI